MDRRLLALAAAIALAPAAAPAASTETVLHRFDGSHGAGPLGALVEPSSNGPYFGTTETGGSAGLGTVFALAPPAAGKTLWTYTLLYSFTGGSDGAWPESGLVADLSGALYGTTEGGATGDGTLFELKPPATGKGAWTLEVLHSFKGKDGAHPLAGLVADRKGVLYGTTAAGGSSTACSYDLGAGCGTVFELVAPATGKNGWHLSVLHNFHKTDGAYPRGPVIVDGKGVLYGTAARGGKASDDGVVFELTPPPAGKKGWSIAALHKFGGTEGGQPWAGLLAGSGGVLYGTTESATVGEGTVFKLTPPAAGKTGWPITVLHRFLGGQDGGHPVAGLIADSSGALYGTTYSGGGSTACLPNGCGTLFALTPPAKGRTAWGETVLHRFAGTDGAEPSAGLVADGAGALYGTTAAGGSCASGSGCGTVFKWAP